MSSKPSFLNQFQRIVGESEGRPLKVLMVGAEVSPYANVGGFSRVTSYLSRALCQLGHDVRLFMPKFGLIDEEKYPMEVVLEGLKVPTGQGKEPTYLICNVKRNQLPGAAPVYFLENMEYYEKRANVYGYSDDPLRWALLSRGALEFLKLSSWTPDIIHAHDWHTGAVANYLRKARNRNNKLSSVATVFTIHNLQFQGIFDHRNIPELDLDDGRAQIASLFSERLKKQNFMRRAILYSDVVNTVSETYSREILTPEYGEGLDRLLLEVRSKLSGIVNGLDHEEFDPATDKLVPVNFDVRSLDRRVENKIALQKEFSLPQNPEIPIFAYVGRLDSQKGLDLVGEVLPPFLKDFDAQFVEVGGGDGKYIEILKKLKEKFPRQVGIHPMSNFTLPRLVFAGSDVLLLPSKFEPCGIVQLEAMRYGAIPIVRATGGLADTVEDFDPQTGRGTGFVFKNFDRWAFFAQVVRAFETYRHKKTWRKLQQNAMQKDFSWENSAREYIKLYEKAIHFRTRDLAIGK
ncbi:glycogen synthase [Candidatus Parcubacteria bacterium]|nr:glycogen synthase [Candidatus Parcubacteria bacterium]